MKQHLDLQVQAESQVLNHFIRPSITSPSMKKVFKSIRDAIGVGCKELKIDVDPHKAFKVFKTIYLDMVDNINLQL